MGQASMLDNTPQHTTKTYLEPIVDLAAAGKHGVTQHDSAGHRHGGRGEEEGGKRSGDAHGYEWCGGGLWVGSVCMVWVRALVGRGCLFDICIHPDGRGGCVSSSGMGVAHGSVAVCRGKEKKAKQLLGTRLLGASLLLT